MTDLKMATNKEVSKYSRVIPAVCEETYKGIEQVDLQTKLFSEGKIFITGEVDEDMAMDVVLKLMYLTEEFESIEIYINSPGGSVNAGLVIYDCIQALKDKVQIDMYCIGMAASMGAVILAGGQKGHRYILPHSKVMIHEPLIAGGMGGSASSIKNTADSILETKALINGILSEHTGKTIEEIDEATSFDNYMNATEAVEFGLVDEVKLFL